MSRAPRPKIINEQAELVPITLVRAHPRNARQGDVGAVYESIMANGFYGHLIVQKSTGYIVAGNHRYFAAAQAGLTEVPVVWLDVDDERALRILLADNRTSDKASYNDARLAELLAELENTTEEKLSGTGYEASDLDDLIEQLARAATNHADDEAAAKKKKGEDRLAIVLICETEDEQTALEDKLKQMGFYPRKTILNERTTLAVG